MAYNKDYMFLHDIDWYACVNNLWIYASSMGGIIPNTVNDENSLREFQRICYNLPDITTPDKIIINDPLIHRRYNRALEVYLSYYREEEYLLYILENYTYDYFKENYTREFKEMACKGFATFIRENIDDFADNTYSLVAYPDIEISNKLTETFRQPLPVWLNYSSLSQYLEKIKFFSSINPLDKDFELSKIII